MIGSILISGCSNNANSEGKEKDNAIIEEMNAFPELIKHFERERNYINESAPSVIKPEFVFKQLKGNIHLIDIRSAVDFAKGHIEGAINVSHKNIITHLWEDVVPSKLEKIIIIGYNGNDAGYVASVLQLINYNKVYAMKWGMAGWNKKFATDNWLSKTSNKYANILVSKLDSLNPSGDYPYIKSCESTCMEALEKRATDLLQKDYSEVSIEIDELLANPDDYYIISYMPKKFYDKFHLPTARYYEPFITLTKDSLLNTLPLDKTIVTYCYSGHHSAFVTAFLNILGYKAKNLEYGTNAFMIDALKENKLKVFTTNNLKNYPYITQ